MDNKFIIITPSYNNAQWFETYYENICEQTYKNYEVFYVDDCSKDETSDVVKQFTANDSRFHYIRNETNMGAMFNYLRGFTDYSNDPNAILVNLDGDDWFPNPHVLEKLNEAYNQNDYWLTYGKMVVYRGGDSCEEAFPQNSPYHPFIHQYQLYRKDMWRASHLRTFRKFLFDKVDRADLYSKIDGQLYWHASDLAFMYPMLEMTPPEKIGVMPFCTYVYNNSKENAVRTAEREKADNSKFEREIRDKRIYVRATSREDLSGNKKHQINMIGDLKERNSIPTKFSFVYNKTDGEYDLTLVQDNDILRVIRGEVKTQGKVIADVHEPQYLFNQSEVFDALYNNASKFHRIFTHNERLLTLPNAKFRPSGYEVVLNKNVHKQTYPILADNSLMKIYPKSKLTSIITSNKAMTEGHRYRIQCLQRLMAEKCPVDAFGVGIREITGKIEALKDYHFSIAMENGKSKNYFTEKIMDCFLTGTIPIYWGCPNIGDFFDTKGFYIFETPEELVSIIKSLTPKDYFDRIELIRENFKRADQLWLDNDRFYEKYLKSEIECS